MAQHPDLCANTKFIDVDFEELMISKREIIMNTPKMKDMLSTTSDLGSGKGVVLDSDVYVAIGCDLRNPSRLERLLRSVVDIDQCLVLCLAEVSITYMATKDADALIAWTSTLSPDVTFCLLEQQSPDRPDNPFTAAMLKHFAKLGTPLRSVLTYPGTHTQTLRFQDAGFPHIEIQNLWELWADPRFLSPSQRISLDEVEEFDEWEEFALFASHYCLIIAQTGPEPLMPEQQRSRRASVDSLASDMSARTVSPHRDNTQWFAYKYSANPEKEGRTHHGSAFIVPGQDAIAVHGGVGLRGRLSSTSVYTSPDSTLPYPSVPPEEVGARCCHTITTLRNGQNLLVGGRGSPSSPMKDCWLQTDTKWERVHDLPEPRFRHRAAAVVLPYDQYGVVVFGGKTSATRIAIDCLLWDKENGWQVLRSLKSDPMPRFGASFVRLGFNHGLLLGGMRQDGVICQGLWKWRLIIRDNKVMGINFRVSTALDASAGIWPWLNRLGASYSVIRDEILLIGGVAKHGCIPKDYEILSIVGSFSAFNEYEKEMEFRVACVLPKRDPNVPRPFLIGHSTHYTARQTTLIIGGGATCFSFGAYWNPGCWLLYDREAGLSSHWAMMKPEARKPDPQSTPQGASAARILTAIERIKIESEQDFTRVLGEGRPKLLSNLDIGPCISSWTAAYLLSKIAPSKSIVVHSASGRTMNFQRKDFAYKTTSFLEFINQLESDPNAHMYLRSISSTNPTTLPADLSTDWPELAPDFHVPHALSFVKNNQHSSPLRISANVNMWLHYDVMANVLFQIRGTRKLVLFPPGDLKHLNFPPGSTTSSIDIFEPTQLPGSGEDTARFVPNTKPHVAILKPGDALYIPPLWAHTGTPLPAPTKPEPLSLSTSVSASASTSTSTSTSESASASASASATASTSAPLPQPTLESPSATTTITEDKPSEAHALHEAHHLPDTNTNASSDSKINISVNVFFRTLNPHKYAAGRDVYGNRDLAAYEDGRRDLEKIVRRFLKVDHDDHDGGGGGGGGGDSTLKPQDAHEDGNGNGKSKGKGKGKGKILQPATGSAEGALDMGIIPKDIVRAYLGRLADELREKADKL
ncbi:Galactose oxidase, central domain-containing protein isoform 1 [Cladophialophora immunda]|nr:Galactose oxidase, central domain-containing protein isoform 1 [Cladophialophora immunda]